MDNQRLTTLLEQQLRDAYKSDSAEVRRSRVRNHRYYSGEKFGNEKAGESQHISMDVFDSVESKKAYYLESLGGSRKVCRFLPHGPDDVEKAPMRDAYVHDVFYNDVGGWGFIRDCLHDAFVAKRCVARVEWRVEREQMEDPIPQGVDPMALVVAVENSMPGAEVDFEAGVIRYEAEAGSHDVSLVQPERFLRDPNADYVQDAQYTIEVWELTRGQAVERGWDPERVAEMVFDRAIANGDEDWSRSAANGGTAAQAHGYSRVQEHELVTAYLTFTYLNARNLEELLGGESAEGYMRDAQPGEYRLFRVVWSQGVVLELEEAEDGVPYLEWTEYKIAHTQHGLADADLQAQIQKSKSTMTRLIINNQAMTNTPRWVAQERMVTNPRELLENHIGGVIWAKTQDAVMPLPTPPLNPLAFNTLELFEAEKEGRSGLSRLSKGMNQDAISHQNADRMIERLTNASNRRVMKGVRDFAENFLKPLFMRLLELAAKYDKNARTVEVTGQWVQISAQQIGPGRRADLAVALTPDERAKLAQGLMMVHQMVMTDPVASQLYGIKERHALLDDLADLMGHPDSSRYLMRPDSQDFKQAQAAQQQMQQAMQQMQQGFMQMQAMLAQSEDQRRWFETRVEAAIKQAGLAMDGEKLDLSERGQKHEEKVDNEKLEIERMKVRSA